MRKRLGNQNISQALKSPLTGVFVFKQKKARVARGGSLFETEQRK